MQKYEKLEKIGEGTYGTVFKVLFFAIIRVVKCASVVHPRLTDPGPIFVLLVKKVKSVCFWAPWIY